LREPALLGELRVSKGARKTITTESTVRGEREMAANDVSRLMPRLSRSFKSPDVRRSFVHHAAMTATGRHWHLLAPAAAGSTWPSLTLRALTNLTGLLGLRQLQHQTSQNLNFSQALSSGAESATRTQARGRSKCQGPWQSKREGGHARRKMVH